MQQHGSAALSIVQRRRLVGLIGSGVPVVRAAAMTGCSDRTARKWRDRYAAEGDRGLCDRSTRPRRSPCRTPQRTERRIVKLRYRWRCSALIIAVHLGNASQRMTEDHYIATAQDLRSYAAQFA